MKSQNLGQSLFEVVIAIAISALIIVALVSLVSSAVRNATYAKNNTLATRYSQEATEWLRGQRDNDIDLFVTNAATPVWCLKDLSWSQSTECGESDFISGTPFIRNAAFGIGTIIVDGVNKTLIEADVIVFWEDSQGIHEVKSATNFTDWRER